MDLISDRSRVTPQESTFIAITRGFSKKRMCILNTKSNIPLQTSLNCSCGHSALNECTHGTVFNRRIKEGVYAFNHSSDVAVW